jgi:VWFA-related protein
LPTIKVALLLLFAVGVAGTSGEQAPTFRSGVDLVSVDVQVVDGEGRPIAGLTPDRFDVLIAGKGRKVVSAEYIAIGAADPRSNDAGSAEYAARRSAGLTPSPERLFFVAIDALSFAPGESRGIAVAAQQFIGRLEPTDYVGLLTFPAGPKLNPTRDHGGAIRALDGMVGQREPFSMKYKLRPSEVIEIVSRQSGCTDRGGGVTSCDPPVEPILAAACRNDELCRRGLIDEARANARHLETVARTSLGTFRDLIRAVAKVPARKIVVLVSAGLIVSGRPGVSPDVGNLPILIGEEAARADVAVYTLFVDYGFTRQFMAEASHASLSLNHMSGDPAVLEQWLGDFTGTVGGALLRVVTGNPELAFTRVIRETSGYYLLGVEPAEADRDSRPRELEVRVDTDQRGSIVRARKWVSVARRE